MDVFAEKISFWKKLLIGFQHVLAMCPGTIAVPLIMAGAMNLDPETTAFLVSANLFTSGVAILLQVFGLGRFIGSKYPIILGSSFAPLAPMILIGNQYGLPTLFGAIMVSGLLIFILSFFLDKILVLFPPVVIGTFVTLIGISLAPTAMQDLAGGVGSSDYGSIQNLLLGLGVLVFIILVEKFGKGIWRAMSLLLGIAGGTLVGALMGMVNVAPVVEANVFQLIDPFHFGLPQFEIGSIVIMTIFCVINMIQCIGVFSVLDEIVGTKTDNATKIRGIKAQAVAQVFTGAFNSVPSTMFNENVSLIDLTKVKSRSVIAVAGVMMLLLGVFPKVSAVITMVPKAVLGGATLALFGVITSSGISILSKLNFFEDNNFTIIGTSIAIGVGATFASDIFVNLPTTLSMICSNGLFMVSISAILLNLLLNGKKGLHRP
ncbi:MAG: nucleobase:cation symporter-2 family protein [Oscillospiraceae bacterium]